MFLYVWFELFDSCYWFPLVGSVRYFTVVCFVVMVVFAGGVVLGLHWDADGGNSVCIFLGLI